jgi:hypothetical protein
VAQLSQRPERNTPRRSAGALQLPLITNEKTVDPRDKKSPKVYQLETAMGAAIECFPTSGAILVPRSRFAPVKTCNDLFALRSDAYDITPQHTVVLNVAAPPLVKLEDSHYKMVDQLVALCEAYPSLKACSKLTVKGAVKFVAGTTLSGAVSVTGAAEPLALPAGEYADQDVTLPLAAAAAEAPAEAPAEEAAAEAPAEAAVEEAPAEAAAEEVAAEEAPAEEAPAEEAAAPAEEAAAEAPAEEAPAE